ncbi:hypothetical protein GWI33_016654 [Rhynchophorus ferrugineus]|uniref:Uncharacterized protein n=1 Tax=Rhynchophorus ferrugineus TaxID=354439 RepID=A0A834HZP1_RHYFE|nr:hypothetical protein GWI33_016654 [Rhynchophorus ferrugineus]
MDYFFALLIYMEPIKYGTTVVINHGQGIKNESEAKQRFWSTATEVQVYHVRVRLFTWAAKHSNPIRAGFYGRGSRGELSLAQPAVLRSRRVIPPISSRLRHLKEAIGLTSRPPYLAAVLYGFLLRVYHRYVPSNQIFVPRWFAAFVAFENSCKVHLRFCFNRRTWPTPSSIYCCCLFVMDNVLFLLYSAPLGPGKCIEGYCPLK